MEPWRTAIANSDETNIWIRGYDIGSLMQRASFADLLFLLHRARLPVPGRAPAAGRDPDRGGRPRCGRAVVRGGPAGRLRESPIAVRGHRGRTAHHRRRARRRRLQLHGDDRGRGGARSQGVAVDPGCGQPGRRGRPGRGPARAGPRASRPHQWIRAWTSCSTWPAKRASPARGSPSCGGWRRPPATRSSPFPSTSTGPWPPCSTTWAFRPAAGQFVFMVGRVAGLTAEVAEEYAREKPMRIRIPVRYDGVPPRPME